MFSQNKTDFDSDSTNNNNNQTIESETPSGNTLDNGVINNIPNDIMNSGNILRSPDDIQNNNIKDKPNQVYNIASNIYTYNDADEVCKAHSGRLATLPYY